MPLIEFRCSKCGHEFEDLIMKHGDFEMVQCPKCRSKELTRLVSACCVRSSGTFSSNTGTSCTSCTQASCTGCSK